MLFRAVKCYKCDTYQVDSVKKVNKWQCRMCGEKQSLQGEYATGSAKECRLQVQRLNMMKADQAAQKDEVAEKILNGEIHLPDDAGKPLGECSVKTSNKWADLHEEDAEDGDLFNPVASKRSLSPWKDVYKQGSHSMENSLGFAAASTARFKGFAAEATDGQDRDSIFAKEVEEKPNPPSWKEFYGKKHETAKQKESNSRKFFNSGSLSGDSSRNRLLPLPNLQKLRKSNDPEGEFSCVSKKFRSE